MNEDFTVRTYEGNPISVINARDLDVAWRIASARFGRTITVDNLPPIGGPKSRTVIRYLDRSWLKTILYAYRYGKRA